MTVEDMVKKLRIMIGDDVEPYFVSTPVIFEWLADAYLRIQMEYEQWKFFHRRGKLFTTQPGVENYTLTGIRVVDENSLYIVRVGDTIKYPLQKQEYGVWQIQETVTAKLQGNPRFLIEAPGGEYKVSPVPTELWEVWGDCWYNPVPFELGTDEPVWDEAFHSLVVWEALKVAAMEWPDDKKAQRMQANLAVNLPTMRRAFNYKYLGAKLGARSML